MTDKISKADRVFFLGFGYAPENMDILKLNRIFTDNHKIYGTALNFKDREIEDVRTVLMSGFKTKDPSMNNPRIKSMDCLELLRKFL